MSDPNSPVSRTRRYEGPASYFFFLLRPVFCCRLKAVIPTEDIRTRDPLPTSFSFFSNCSTAARGRNPRKTRTLASTARTRLLDLFGVEFLPVITVIGVASYVALSVTDKRHASQIVLHEERLRA
jgi:hypothetical protein